MFAHYSKLQNPKAVVEGVQKAEQLIKEQQREINELNSKLAVAQIGQLLQAQRRKTV